MRILTWYIGLFCRTINYLQALTSPSPILFCVELDTSFILGLNDVFSNARNSFHHRTISHLARSLCMVLPIPSEPLTGVLRGFLELPHSLQIHVKLNLQLRNHLKIKSVAALPHSIRWSTISYLATSITTYKLDHLQVTNSWPWPYKARIFSFSTRRLSSVLTMLVEAW